jgi:flagellar FliL protein
MSTAAAVDAAPKGKKKLLILIIAAVVLLAVVGGALAMMKKKAADADEDSGDDAAPAHVAAKHDPKAAPTFVPLDTFTVNLADRETERYAQVGITLEVADPHVSEEIKAYMPAIRNNVLLVLADKTAAQLMDREGKVKLAEQVRRETARAMGYEVADPDAKAADDSAADDADGDGDAPKKKPRRRKKKSAEQELPITAVHFSNFIIQ